MGTRIGVGLLLTLLSVSHVRAEGLRWQGVAREIFAAQQQGGAVGARGEAPSMPLPLSISIDQYAYLTAQQGYLTGILQRILSALEQLDAAKRASDAIYMDRIGKLEISLERRIDDKGVGDLSKWATFGTAAGSFGVGLIQSLNAGKRCTP